MAGFEKRAKRYPTDLTDEEWLFIQPFLPPVPKLGRKATTDLRDVLDAPRYLARTGGGWQMLPNDFPPWQTVYWWNSPREPASTEADIRVLMPHLPMLGQRFGDANRGLPPVRPVDRLSRNATASRHLLRGVNTLWSPPRCSRPQAARQSRSISSR
jgi:transposase